ncbi:MAG TPA: hypothetical protein VG347_12700 [Verrucomicrobiae bacterium]|nr:hypothetical protein [Verrucomicrobiae bacterium]
MLTFQTPSSFQAIIRRGLSVLAAVLMLAGFISRSLAVDDTFYNNTLYTSINNINATNVINDFGGTFSVIPGVGNGWLNDLYDAWFYTRNFTNNGEMDSPTGFLFQKHITATQMEADTFYNKGNINCGTTSGSLFIISGQGLILSQIGGFGGIQVWATNVYNSGTITIGADGLARINGHNLDFTRGTMTMLNGFLGALPTTSATNPPTATIFATGQTGKNTNDWFPDFELAPTFADTSLPPLFNLSSFPGFTTTFLPNTQPYASVRPDATGTNIVVRMIFVENDTTNVPYNVYFTNANAFANGFGTVEFVGSYINPVNGQTKTHYLYLTDDFVQGGSTNILSYPGAGIPNNYTITETTTKALNGPAEVSNYPALFPPGQPFPAGADINSNIYSYVNASLTASTISTNSVVNGAITNLPGRFELVASNELNLSQTRMSGMNYLLLRSTNNFDTDGRSLITSPYSDVYLGRTNGSLVVSNLLLSSIPIWSGTLQAWNTRWLYTDTNQGVNYDFRVLVVDSSLSSVSSAQEQDFMLYSSNNVTISDTLNITRNFFANCTNMLLTQNPPGYGASALDGELNLPSQNISWSTATPRLRNLTNNGAIRTLTQSFYGSPALPYYAFVNTGTVSNGAGVQITASDFENSGPFLAGSGSFIVNSTFTTMTNGSVTAAGIFSNSSSLFVASNTVILAGNSFSILATNVLTDGGTTNNFWSLGTSNAGLGFAPGLVVPVLPPTASLLGTTITNLAVSGSLVTDVWPGKDYGAVNAGFNNNAAIGQLVLDAQASSDTTGYMFNGVATDGTTNAIYVDCLQLHDYASYNFRSPTTTAIPVLNFNTNLVIYYAQALIDDGSSVAEKINHFNGDHLRWVPTYAGTFSSTNLIYPDGSVNTVNAALKAASDIDSDGDGTPNNQDTSPILTSSQLNFTITLTNLPPKSVKLKWTTTGNGTNYIYYKTNLLSPTWMPFTNFKNFYYDPGQSGTNLLHTNWFPSGMGYPAPSVPVWIYDGLTNMPHFYRVVVQPYVTGPNGI